MPFHLPEFLSANPQLYDYVHDMQFSTGGTVKLTDGAGQVINMEIEARYSIRGLEHDRAEITFSDLRNAHPFREPADESIADFSVELTREAGIFPFRSQVIWNVRDEDEWPCLLYRVRYVFDADPLAFARNQRFGNLYYFGGDESQAANERYYYAREDRQELTAREMDDLGIARELYW